MAHGKKQEYIKYQEYVPKLKSRFFNKEGIQQSESKLVKDIIDEPIYPTDLTLSIFAAAVYNKEVEDNLYEGLQPLKKRKNVTAQVVKNIEEIEQANEWRLLAWGENPDDGYFGAAFWNENRNQLVISHRGTVPKETKTLVTDLEGVIRRQYTSQIHSACTFSALVLHDLDLGKIQVSVTGHSLGAWLAQITTFTTEYLTLEQEIFTIRKEGLRDPKSQVHAVVFDSPGCYEMLCQIAGHYFAKYKHEAFNLISVLDITIYFNKPNLVNSLNSHHGISTLFQILEISENVTSEKNETWYDLDSHKSMNFIRMLSSPDNANVWTVLNWPSFVFPKAGKNKKSGKPLSVKKSMAKIIKLAFTSVNVLFSSDYELLDYYKQIDGVRENEEGKCIGGIVINHKTVEIDQKSRNISIFSEKQIKFLKYWKRVKDEKVAADKFKNIQETLQKNNLEGFNDFLPFFDFYIDESNKKKIRFHSKEDLEKVIRRVKNLLALYPEAFDHIEDDAKELLTTYETLYKSYSESYLQTLPSLEVDFKDTYDIQEFLKSKEKVLALITKNDTKYEMFRVRNLLKNRDANEQCYLGLTELEKIIQHVDAKQIFEDPDCHVDKVLILDCHAEQGFKIEKYFEDFLKTAKISINDKKLILVLHDSYDWLRNLLNQREVRAEEVEFSFLHLTQETQEKLFTKEIVTLWNKKIKLAKFLNVVNSQEQINFLSNPDFLFPLMTANTYVNLELSSQKVINYDSLKVLIIDLQKNIELVRMEGFLKANPKDLEKIFEKLILFVITGILKNVFESRFDEISSNIIFANNDFSNVDFVDLCRQNMCKRIYWIHFLDNSFNNVELRKIFDPDFYIERQMLKQKIIDKTMFGQFLKEVNQGQIFIISDITRENFFQLLNIDSEMALEFESLGTVDIGKISRNIFVFAENRDEALVLFDNADEDRIHLFVYKKCCQKCIWTRSKGPLNTIRNIVSFDKVILTELDLIKIPDKTVIIASESGTGKSTLLLRYAKTLTSSWVIWVKLVEYRKKFDNIEAEENLENVVEFLLKCNENSLNNFTKSLLKFNLTHKTQTPVVIFFDGYDEIVNEEIQTKMLKIFKFLQKETNARIWITTKIWAKEILEDELSAFSIKIREIEKDQQRKFIKSFWLAGDLINTDNLNEQKSVLDDKAEEFFRESEKSLIIQRYLSAKDCSALEKAWDCLLNTRYENEILDGLRKYMRTIYRLTKNGEGESLDRNIASAILNLYNNEEINEIGNGLIEFLVILNLAWHLDQVRNFYSQRFIQNKYLESLDNVTSYSEEELAKRELAKLFIEILLVSYEDKVENLPQIHDIFAIPLQLRMIGEILHLQKDTEMSMEIPVKLLSDHHSLYEKFMSIKFHIYNKKKLKKEEKSMESKLKERHQCLAMQLLFPDQYKDILEEDEIFDPPFDQPEILESWTQDIIKMNQIGIVDMNNSGAFAFNHISFAEYFIARMIFNFLKKKNSSNRSLKDLIITEILLKDENIMIRKFLDGMLVYATAVMFKFFEKKFSSVNTMGESALHVCASENLSSLARALLKSFKDESRLRAFMSIKNIYNETAFHYTATNNQTEFATMILIYGPNENIIRFEADQVSSILKEESKLATEIFFSISLKDVHIFMVQNKKVTDIANFDSENIPKLLNLISKFGKIEHMSDSTLNFFLIFAIEHESTELALSILTRNASSLPMTKLLHHASGKGLKSVVLKLLEMGADINTTECKCKSTPLYLAAQNSHWDLVSDLIDKGAKIDTLCTDDESTVLHEAASSGKLNIIQKLLDRGANVNVIEKGSKFTPITTAASNNHWDAVLQFLEPKYKVNPNVPALEEEITLLHFAAASQVPIETVKKIIEAGADVNAIETSSGFTPIMRSAHNQRWDIVLELISKGADVNIPSFKYKQTVLHYAAMYEATEVVVALLEAGADVNAKELTHYVVAINMAAINDDWKTVLELIRRNADVNIPIKNTGCTILHFAAAEGELDVVIELIKHGANINVINNFNWTPLNLAVKEKHWNIVSVLLQQGAKIDAVEGGRKYLLEKAKNDGKLEWLYEIINEIINKSEHNNQ